MTDLTDLLAADGVEAALHVTSKKGLFQQLATAAGRLTGIDPKIIHTAISDREKSGSTGFGAGVAIPHG
ncbi:MAG TPA: PTS sugar transporter subunit IIA, partial [Allosphingosinicella sp.]